MKAFSTMLKTEIKLAIRGMDMIIFAQIMPVVVTVIIGIIFGTKPAFEGAGYTFFAQSFGALATIGICASGVMGLPLVIADYRHNGILKRFQVTPVSPSMILFVQVTAHFIQSVLSALLVYAVSAAFFGFRMQGSVLAFIGAFMLVLISIYSIGVLIAGVSSNTKVSNILCSVFYFPMLLFSGATLPYEVMPPVLQRVADVMPLTQGIKLLKATSLGLPIETTAIPLVVMALIAVICIVSSVLFFRWE